MDSPRVTEIDDLFRVSNEFYNKQDYVKSLKTNIQILELAKELQDPSYLRKVYRFLAYDYLVLSDTIMAKQNFKEAENYAALSESDASIAESFMDLGNFYSIATKDHSKVMWYLNKAISNFIKIKDTVGLQKAYFNVILASYDAEKIETIAPYLNELNRSDYRLHQDISMRSAIDTHAAEFFITKKDYVKVDSLIQNVLVIADKNDLPVDKEYALDVWSKSLYKRGEYQKAYDQRLLFEELSEKNRKTFEDEESAEASSKFQVEEYKRMNKEISLENKLQEERVSNQKLLNNILIVLGIVGLLMFLGLLLAFRKRKQLVEKLKERNRKYLEAKYKSEHLAKSKSNFFSTVSHELRTPLYGVIGLSSILLEDKSLKSHEKDLKSLKFSADYLLALINDVLLINKLDSKNADNDRSNFNLQELVQNVLNSFEYIRLQNNNLVEVHISDEIPKSLNGNAVRLSQILMNLLGNAFKFTENGVITVDVRFISNIDGTVTLRFSIKDTGIGIAKEKQKGIFNEFEQIESIDYSYQGTGLGLPIVKKLLTLSNSKIHLESELGKGALFSFELFYEEAPQEDSEILETSLDTTVLKGKHILIVEDNRINQIVTQKILEKKGIICSLVENGDLAIEAVRVNNFDLVLMDLNMPVKGGIAATKEIRLFNREIPIIALTAVEVEEVRNEIAIAGMNDIIVKPYDAMKFTRIIIKNLMMKVNIVTNSSSKTG